MASHSRRTLRGRVALNDYGPNGQENLLGRLATNTCACGRYFDYGPDAGDDTRVFRLSGNYALPAIQSRAADKAMNGWNLSYIPNWQSGFPYTPFAEDDNSFSAIGC